MNKQVFEYNYKEVYCKHDFNKPKFNFWYYFFRNDYMPLRYFYAKCKWCSAIFLPLHCTEGYPNGIIINESTHLIIKVWEPIFKGNQNG